MFYIIKSYSTRADAWVEYYVSVKKYTENNKNITIYFISLKVILIKTLK